jgi:hypothetical protein
MSTNSEFAQIFRNFSLARLQRLAKGTALFRHPEGFAAAVKELHSSV